MSLLGGPNIFSSRQILVTHRLMDKKLNSFIYIFVVSCHFFSKLVRQGVSCKAEN